MTMTTPAPVRRWADPADHSMTCEWQIGTRNGMRDKVAAANWFTDYADGFVHFETNGKLVLSVRADEVNYIRPLPQGE